MRTGRYFFEKRIIVVFILYFLLSGMLLFHYGIQTGGEAEKYLDNANRILHGRELRNGFFGIFYLAYSLVVSFFVKFSLSIVFIAVLQIFFSFVAAFSLYKLLVNSLENRSIAFLSFIAYLCCYPIQKWNFFLYSESMHTSFLVIGTYLFEKLLREKKYATVISFSAMLVLIFFSRPVGLLYLVSITTVFLAWSYFNKRRALFYFSLLAGMAAVVVVVNSPVSSFVNPDSLMRMEVICQVPEVSSDRAYQEFNPAGLYKVYTVIKDDIGFGKFFMNGAKKLGCFFGMYRTYYSWQNNLLLLLYTVFYPFVIIGIFSKQGKSFFYVKMLSVLYLLFTSIAIFFTCDDWANRFISPAFPFILILAAGGLFWTVKKVNAGRS